MIKRGIIALLLFLGYVYTEDGFLVSFRVPPESVALSTTHRAFPASTGSTSTPTTNVIVSAIPTISSRIVTSVLEQRAQFDDPRFPMVHPIPKDEQLIDQINISDETIATTMITDTDFLGNPITTPSTFILEPSRKAFQSCIFGCSTVTVPCTTDTGSTVIVVLPLTIPCSLVKCPPCNTCISSTVSITVCPVITTITPQPATATIFTTAISIATEKCQALIDAAVHSVAVRVSESIVTVTRTKAPVGCPAASAFGGEVDLVTSTLNVASVCSTFVVCQAKRFTCPLPIAESVDGIHMIDTVQAILASQSPTTLSLDQSNAETADVASTSSIKSTSSISMIAERMFQTNFASTAKPLIFGPLLSILIMVMIV